MMLSSRAFSLNLGRQVEQSEPDEAHLQHQSLVPTQSDFGPIRCGLVLGKHPLLSGWSTLQFQDESQLGRNQSLCSSRGITAVLHSYHWGVVSTSCPILPLGVHRLSGCSGRLERQGSWVSILCCPPPLCRWPEGRQFTSWLQFLIP